ncbi:MAG: septum formation protein Maf [Nevskia sp.]|nr:septum formation protein Maf [Nevskia sp.]
MALPPPSPAAPLILASGSRYRAGLLRRLQVPFVQESPGSDEAAHPGEAPAALAQRLALLKAGAVAARHPGRWVLGSDQVCACGDALLGKPGSRAGAVRQLAALGGRAAQFYTAVALLRDGAPPLTALDLTTVRFRRLGAEEIERYVDAEPAYDCAGSFMSEGLGISLCEAVASEDPTALVGLPLIAVRRLLAQAGYAIP